MIERLIEDWLIKAEERAFQYPFAHGLAAQGHVVVHVTRHCGMELGKDILTIAPDGVPCAYQLKHVRGRRINLGQWRAEVGNQISDLVFGRIVHPSISSDRPHRSHIVLNGDIDEDVARSVDDFNEANARNGRPHHRLLVVTKGEMLASLLNLRSNFWPEEISDSRPVVRMLLADGEDMLEKATLATVLNGLLSLDPTDASDPPKATVVFRSVVSGALMTAFAIANYTRKENHFAEFEAWILFLAHAAAAIERSKLNFNDVETTLLVAEQAALNALKNLVHEASDRDSFLDPRMIPDKAILRARTTMVVGSAALAYLWLSSIGERDTDTCERASAIVKKHYSKIELWGESAAPSTVCQYEAMRRIFANRIPDEFLAHVIEGLTVALGPKSKRAFPDPYIGASEAMVSSLEPAKDAADWDASGRSWTLEAFWHLFVRLNWKRRAAAMWPEMSKIAIEQFVPEHSWQAYLWRTNRGTCRTVLQPPKQSWTGLRTAAQESSGVNVPLRFRENPCLYLSFLVVYPHRINAEGVRWLDTALKVSCR